MLTGVRKPPEDALGNVFKGQKAAEIGHFNRTLSAIRVRRLHDGEPNILPLDTNNVAPVRLLKLFCVARGDAVEFAVVPRPVALKAIAIQPAQDVQDRCLLPMRASLPPVCFKHHVTHRIQGLFSPLENCRICTLRVDDENVHLRKLQVMHKCVHSGQRHWGSPALRTKLSHFSIQSGCLQPRRTIGKFHRIPV